MTNIVGAVIALAATIALLVWVIVRSPFGDVNTFAIIICVALVIGAVLRIFSALTGRRSPTPTAGVGHAWRWWRSRRPASGGPRRAWPSSVLARSAST